MLLTIFAYFVVPLFLILFLRLPVQKLHHVENSSGQSFTVFFGIVLISVLFGLRDLSIGYDYHRYVEAYNRFDEGYSNSRFELGFTVLNQIFNWLNLHFTIFFGSIFFITLFFVYKSLKMLNQSTGIISLFTFVLFTHGFIFDSTNILRHTLAFSIFAFSLKYIQKRNFWLYFLLICIAATFHKSAILLIPLYFFIHHDLTRYRFPIILAMIISLVFSVAKTNIITGKILSVFELLNYDNYIDNQVRFMRIAGQVERHFGLGFVFLTLVDLVLIFFMNGVKKKFPNINIYLSLHMLGLIFSFLTVDAMLLYRINYYFITMRIFTISALLYYLLRSKDSTKVIVGIFCLIIYLIAYSSKIFSADSNYYPFTFFWQ